MDEWIDGGSIIECGNQPENELSFSAEDSFTITNVDLGDWPTVVIRLIRTILVGNGAGVVANRNHKMETGDLRIIVQNQVGRIGTPHTDSLIARDPFCQNYFVLRLPTSFNNHVFKHRFVTWACLTGRMVPGHLEQVMLAHVSFCEKENQQSLTSRKRCSLAEQ